ncbi:putative HTH-type transcriptional regulator YxaF [Variibacter gotjawalensis]|uniref:Putative HTH-type transcriptional regulator YxaF n=1 Tax=Variibacter gotjawalensis TaxID=1333996 RepID=A0A0S3Q078_9BRAD|nr:TetR/AcrR family transcriptional regulator [Variibacter gotjawalensis]NIK47430.1 TetR/AcrR family transcriptional repressor of lmrAB and yxaGH operons [Variibacter gotjawalensis]RZS49325.1 TetR family transcriptional regulator [Variibacter gotjawalensis]BAT61589.1 putative HTH-type transcriptional regulator YxaF [Variibacter gotjawalensis]
MARKTDSKSKTVMTAIKLFSRRGYHGTALNDILDASGAPRGSLYFHFPNGKEEIGTEAATLAGGAVRAMIADAAANSRDAAGFLTRIVRTMGANLEASGFTEGCPLATVALETAAESESLGAAARAAFKSWEKEIDDGLARYDVAASAALATMVLNQIEGALMLARTHRDLEPMRRAEEAALILLRAISAPS